MIVLNKMCHCKPFGFSNSIFFPPLPFSDIYDNI